MTLAIEESTGLIYEGTSGYGHGLWPTPLISPAVLTRPDVARNTLLKPVATSALDMIFREDSFDPVSRLRRGRLYKQGGATRPIEWHLYTHPARSSEDTGRKDYQGLFIKPIYQFDPYRGLANLVTAHRDTILLVGSVTAFSQWEIVDIETTVSQEEVVTIRAINTLGVLPALLEHRVPEPIRQKVISLLNRVADAAYREGPESLVDHCRDAASVILSAYLVHEHADPKAGHLELAKMADRLEKLQPPRRLLANATKILADLHSRRKPNVQERLGTRPLNQADAQTSLQLIRTILHEVGWSN